KKENKRPGRMTLKGTIDTSGVPTGELCLKKVGGEITGSDTGDPESGADQIFTAVEANQERNSGLNVFCARAGRKSCYPQGAIDAGVKGQVVVSFVVERDGRLTDIKVIKDLSYGTGTAAVNVLKKAKPWKPGIQNGRPVRVAYTLPIPLNLQL